MPSVFSRVATALRKDGTPLLSGEDLIVFSAANEEAQNVINQGQENEPDVVLPEGFDGEIKKVLDVFERALHKFNMVDAYRDVFLQKVGLWVPHCKNTIYLLRGLAEEMISGKFTINYLQFLGALCRVVAGVALGMYPGLLFSAFGILSNLAVFGATVDEIRIMKINLRKARTLIEDEMAQLSAMADWFYCPQALHEVIYSLIDYETHKKMSQEVQKFHEEVAARKDMEEDEIKKKFDRVLKYCMEKMAKDSNIPKNYGEVLAPAVMSFVFVVCLMKDKNRINLDCAVITTRLAVDLLSGLNVGILGLGLAGNLVGEAAAFELCRYAGSAMARWSVVVTDILIAVCSYFELHNCADPEHAKKIKEAADEFEKILFYVETVYNETKNYKC